MIHNTIRHQRDLLGMSQEALAKAVGVSRQTIVSLEKGGYNPSLELSFRLAHVLNVSLEVLFTWEEEAS